LPSNQWPPLTSILPSAEPAEMESPTHNTGQGSEEFHAVSDKELEAKSALFKSGHPVVPSTDEEKESRAGFSSQIEYIMTIIGMAVGLGNIWRFPAVAYQNGGGAFLVPYLCIGMLFGLPMLYIDSTIGQFTQSGPSLAFKKYLPAAQGLGWTMAFIVISIGFFYNVPICWSLIYIVQLAIGNMPQMTSCSNDWNTIHCDSSLFCEGKVDAISKETLVYFNGSCLTKDDRSIAMKVVGMNVIFQSAPEEYFYYHIAQKHQSFDFGHANWMVAVSLLVCWIITGAGLVKGVQSIGKVSIVTTSLPYLIITVLFLRGVTLPGAEKGLQYFLTNPDWSKIFQISTWSAALNQSCFSLGIGVGTMIMMSCYNKREHPNYRDCVIILAADTFMSVLGGTAVFAILGSMSERMGVSIDKVVSSPLTLAFITYPEATSHMPISTLWALLFFLMLFLIGISTMFAIVEGFTTCLIDEFPKLGKHHWLVVTIVCVVCYALNILCFAFQV
ncbi:hypothetical protein PFISCL1PPCAC_5481, partial [Pristionchus fissidentatus]